MSEFLSGCNRFGIDNPCPILTKRLSTYGNDENVLKDWEQEVSKAAKDLQKKSSKEFNSKKSS